VHGRYGTLTLSADGSFTYTDTTNPLLENILLLLNHGTLQDTFTYTVSDGNGGTASSTLTVDIGAAPVVSTSSISGGAILTEAIQHLTSTTGEVWGIYNCTGFVYTLSYEVSPSIAFFDPADSDAAWVGPRGSDNTGPLLNTNPTANNANNPNFPVPIGFAQESLSSVAWHLSNGETVYSNPIPSGDGWQLVGNSQGNYTTTINPDDPSSIPQPGDLFRGVVEEANGTLIIHSGVIAAYDAATDSIWVISNWESNTRAGDAPITYDQFFLGASGHSRDIVGPFAIYRVENTSIDNVIVGGPGADYLGAGQGNNTLTGGGGADTFIFTTNFGPTTITDFRPGQDILQIDRALFHNFAAIHADMVQVNGNTIITYAPSETITLLGVLPSSLHAQDFHFV